MGHYYHILLKSPLYEQTICNWVVLTWNCEFFNASATLPSLPSVQTDSLLNYYPPTTISSCASTVGYKICLAAGTAWCSLSKLNVSPEEHEKLLINMQNEYVSGGLAAIISCVDQRRQHVIYSRLRQQRGEDAFTLWSYFNTHTHTFSFPKSFEKKQKKKTSGYVLLASWWFSLLSRPSGNQKSLFCCLFSTDCCAPSPISK